MYSHRYVILITHLFNFLTKLIYQQIHSINIMKLKEIFNLTGRQKYKLFFYAKIVADITVIIGMCIGLYFIAKVLWGF